MNGPNRPSKHLRPLLRKITTVDGEDAIIAVGTYHATKKPPWMRRAENRRNNRRARAARKANR